MIDNNCIHAKVCGYSGFAVEDCSKCQFREYNTTDLNREVVDAAKLLKAIEQYGPDLCEYCGFSTLSGYSIEAIREVVEAQKETHQETVGVWIEHEWAEEVEGLLISNYECPHCHNWLRDETEFCPNCGKRVTRQKGET